MADAVLVAGGLLLVASVVLDAALTTLSLARGAGPPTRRASRLVWKLMRGVAGRGPSRHGLLRWTGTLVLSSVVAAWVAGLWLGWFLVFSAGEATVVDRDGQPADGWSRAYFAGFSIFSLGVGDYTPGTAPAQVATSFAVLTGLLLVTLGITYLLQVVSAVVDKRTVAAYVAALGADPVDIVRRGWAGDRFTAMFEQHLAALTPEVLRLGERHLAFPVVHYFHADTPAKSAPAALTVLDAAVHLLRVGVHPQHRPDTAAVEPLSRALQQLVRTLGGSFIPVADKPADMPALEELSGAGVPVADADTYREAVTGGQEHRRRLRAWCISDGWDQPILRLTDD